MDGDLVIGLAVLFAIVVTVGSLLYAAKRSSEGYYDDYGRKIPLDEMKQQSRKQEEEITRMRAQLETEKQHSGNVLQKLEQLERRIEKLEKRGE